MSTEEGWMKLKETRAEGRWLADLEEGKKLTDHPHRIIRSVPGHGPQPAYYLGHSLPL